MESDKLLSPGETAKLLGVNTKTLLRWAKAKKIGYIRTLGGHRRYRESTVNALLEEQ